MTIEQLELEALGLTEPDRVRLANRLIASLSGADAIEDDLWPDAEEDRIREGDETGWTAEEEWCAVFDHRRRRPA